MCVCVCAPQPSFLVPQGMIPKEILHTITERNLVSLVNSVGVDVTACMEHPHWAAALQYACGLGPRKAAYIVRVSMFCASTVLPIAAISFGLVVREVREMRELVMCPSSHQYSSDSVLYPDHTH